MEQIDPDKYKKFMKYSSMLQTFTNLKNYATLTTSELQEIQISSDFNISDVFVSFKPGYLSSCIRSRQQIEKFNTSFIKFNSLRLLFKSESF